MSCKCLVSVGLIWNILLQRGSNSPGFSLIWVRPKVRLRSPASIECRATTSGYLSIKMSLIKGRSSSLYLLKSTASAALAKTCVGSSIPLGSIMS